MSKKEIRSYNLNELIQEMETLGHKKFRAKQIYEWLHVKLAVSFDEMSNLPKTLRERLSADYDVGMLSLAEHQISRQDDTNKFLFGLSDGYVVESVLMRYKHGNSVCISSQVGCRMGCVFCASTIGGLSRNLSVAEMLGQVYAIQKLNGERISNIVVMGTGEPLDNYDNFLKFIRMISDEHGLNISQRNITVSTCGLIDEIRRLADERLQITLALSLHGANQQKRESLMPIARHNNLDDVLAACDYYFTRTGRRVTCEYSLVEGVNDTDRDVAELTALLKDRKFHLNVIPVNPIKERNFVRPSRENARKFQNKLEKNMINVTIRREMGSDIDGACGQLRRKHISKEKDL